MVVAAASTTPNLKTTSQGRGRAPVPNSTTRRPLLPSESENNNVAAHRRPKSKEVSSRYLSTSSSSSTSASSSSSFSNSSYLSSYRRCPSPIASRAGTRTAATPLPNPSTIKRSQSVERRRPATPRPNGGDMPAAAKMLVSSVRSLSASFQCDFRTKPAPSPNLRKATPERKSTTSNLVTPRKEGDQGENLKPAEQRRWPARSRQANSVISLTRSVDLGSERKKLLSGSTNVVRALQKSLIDERPLSSNDKLRKDLSTAELVKGVRDSANANLPNGSSLASESTASDTDSVCSDSNSGKQENGKAVQGRGAPRGLVVPAKFWQETNNRLRRPPEPGLPLARSSSLKAAAAPKLAVPKKVAAETPVSSPEGSTINRGLSPLRRTARPASPANLATTSGPASPSRLSAPARAASPSRLSAPARPASPSRLSAPARAASPSRLSASTRSVSPSRLSASARPASPSRPSSFSRPASPNRLSAPLRPASPSRPTSSLRPSSPGRLSTSSSLEKPSPSRGMPSPGRVRNAITGAFGGNMSSTPSVLSFAADVRRGKVGENRLGDAHLLRLMYNRHLQWRFVNARAEAVLSVQEHNAQKSLYNAWRTTSDLRVTVSTKRRELQLLRQKLKLNSILKGQMSFLEEWSLMEKDHCSSLLGATESLMASTIRLPVVGGVRANVQDLKDAICSTNDVMQAMASSICSLISKVEEVNILAAEVASITGKERALLDECRDILSTLAAMQVKDCSLRTHILQAKRAPTNLAIEA